MSERKETLPQIIFCGAFGGLISDACVHPIDTLRARIQTTKTRNLGLKETFTSLVSAEGGRACYKGFGAVAACTVPAHALYFAGYEMGKNAFGAENRDSPFVHFFAGVVADIWGSFVWVPQDIVKQRLQVEKRASEAKYKTTLQATKLIFQEEGVAGFFKGYWAALATYGPFVGIYFVTYEFLKKKYLTHFEKEHLPFSLGLFFGASAGAVSAALTCPMDVVKTRLQVETTTQKDGYKGMADAIVRIFREEGLFAFWKGLVARTLWVAPGTAITIACYDGLKQVWDRL